jgi:hypothetical protein
VPGQSHPATTGLQILQYARHIIETILQVSVFAFACTRDLLDDNLGVAVDIGTLNFGMLGDPRFQPLLKKVGIAY